MWIASVLPAVDLDDQALFATDEIDNERANGLLAAVFAAIRWPHGVALKLFGALDQAKQIPNGNAG